MILLSPEEAAAREKALDEFWTSSVFANDRSRVELADIAFCLGWMAAREYYTK